MLEQQRAGENRQAAQQEHPCGIGSGRHGDRILFLQHRTERPARRRAKHEERSERCDADRLVGFAQKQRQARDAEREAERFRRGEAFAQQPHRERHGEHRHRIAEDRRAARRDHREPKRDEDIPRGDVQNREHPQTPPLAARPGYALPAEPQHKEQHRGAEAQAQRAEGPWRHFCKRQLHRGPVEAPGEGQRAEQPPQPCRQVVGLRAQDPRRMGKAFMPRRTIESSHSTRPAAGSMWRQRARTAGSATWPSSRANGKPRQICAP